MSTDTPYCPECWKLQRDWTEVAIHMVKKHQLHYVPRHSRSTEPMPGYITCVCGKLFAGSMGLGQHLAALEGMGLLRIHTFVIEELKKL